MRYRADIDGLRAIAVLGVLIYHAKLSLGGDLLLPGGFIGVDVFFVISGFLITSIILRHSQDNRFSLLTFWIRRARRILPILLVVTAATLAAAWLILLPVPMVELATSALAALGFVSNFLFWLEDGYTAEPSQLKPLLHTWSLAVEEQFYLIFPPLFLVLLGRKKAVVLSVISLVILASLALAQLTSTFAPSFAFFIAPSRAWELMIGTFIAVLSFHGHLAGRGPMQRHLPDLGVILIILSFVFFSNETRHPSFWTLVPVLGTGLILAFGHLKGITNWILTTQAMVWLGLISFSLYLWHWPIFVFFRGVGLEDYIWIAVLLSLALSGASYWAIERPFRQSLRMRTVALSGGLFGGSLIVVLIGVVVANGVPSRFSVDIADSYRDGYEFGGRECHHHDRCVVNWEADTPKFVLVGDSHAGAMSGALGRYLVENGFGYAQFTSSACLQIFGLRVRARNDRFHEDCMARAAEVDALLSTTPKVTVIHFGFYTHWLTDVTARDFNGQSEGSTLDPDLPGRTVTQILQQTFSGWREMGHDVLLIGPVPELLFHPFASFKGNGFAKPEDRALNSRAKHDLQSAPFWDLLALYSTDSAVQMFDPADIFCPDGTCLYRTDAGVLYTDRNHLSGKGGQFLLEGLIAKGILPPLNSPK